MGLDITAYSGLRLVNDKAAAIKLAKLETSMYDEEELKEYGEDDYFDMMRNDADSRGQIYLEKMHQEEFPMSVDPNFVDGVYSYQDHFSFRAGSYSGYFEFRAALLALAQDKPYLEGTRHQELNIFWDRCAEQPGLAVTTPFGQLINFSDCEGFITEPAITKLYFNFEDLEYRDALTGYYEETYNNFLKALELASPNGVLYFS